MNRQAIIAGWVGVGVALVLILSFELIFAVQSIVFWLALPAGLLIGYYANARARAGAEAPAARGWGRMLVDAATAGAMTAVALAVVYAGIRLIFFYFDNGYRPDGTLYRCSSGPECSYARSLDSPPAREILESAGVRNVEQFTAYFLEAQGAGAAILLVLVMAGALGGGVLFGAAIPRSGSSTGSA